MLAILLGLAAVSVLAGACDVCSGRQVLSAPESQVDLPAGGDFADCDCEFVFEFSLGTSAGRLDLVRGVVGAQLSIFTSKQAGARPVASFSSDDVVQSGCFFSETGVVRVVFRTGPSPPPDAALTIAVTSINQAPIFTSRVDSSYLGVAVFSFADTVVPIPVTVADHDNFDRGLRVELALETAAGTAPLFALIVPGLPGLTFEEGAAGVAQRRVVISGRGSVVEAAVAASQLAVLRLSRYDTDELVARAADLGNSGEGGPLESVHRQLLGVYADGEISVPRAGDYSLSSGIYAPSVPVSATFIISDAYQMTFTELSLTTLDGTVNSECGDFLFVLDGQGNALSEALCGFNQAHPTFVSRTGSFIVILEMISPFSFGFNADLSPTPDGFRVWMLGGSRLLEAAPNRQLAVPQIMITSLPDETELVVNATAAGALSLRFGDSFSDLIAPSDRGTVSLAGRVGPGDHVMVRLGEALGNMIYTPPPNHDGTDQIVIRASSGGQEAVSIAIDVAISGVAINAPTSLALHAFQPVALDVVILSAASNTNVTVSTATGIGAVSVDHRAALWIDVGFARSLTVPASALANLVYRADFGGSDIVTLTVGTQARDIVLDVDPECAGHHVLYGRQGTFTERAGPVQDPYSSEMVCTFEVYGASRLSMDYFDLGVSTYFAVYEIAVALFVFDGFFPPIGSLPSPREYFHVEINGSGASRGGFVASFWHADADPPPLIVAPTEPVQVLQRSTTLLRGLYVNDYAPGPIRVIVEVDRGGLQTPGTLSIDSTAADFDELDAIMTSIHFVSDEATVARATVRASDSNGGVAEATFEIEVLSCQGLAAVALPEATASAVVSDGSGRGDYLPDLACQWRLTGASAPAVLDVTFLDTECVYDELVVFDGSTPAGRKIGSFCSATQIASGGALVSTTGSFFLSLETDALLQFDGFSLTYRSLGSAEPTALGSAPVEHDPIRTGAAFVALGASSLVVVGGWNGARPVIEPLAFRVDAGWQALVPSSDEAPAPAPRHQVAGVGLDAARLVIHGGISPDDDVLPDTWLGTVDLEAGSITWSLVATDGPASTGASMHLMADASVLLVEPGAVWTMTPLVGVGDGERQDPSFTWQQSGSAPDDLIAGTIAQSDALGRFFGVAVDGTLWSMDAVSLEWDPVGVDVGAAVSGAMLGVTEYLAVDGDGRGHRVNVTSLETVAIDAEPGVAASGAYLGQPAVFVYGGGGMTVVALTLGVTGVMPRVSPAAGGTVFTIAGDQLSACRLAMCQFGPHLSPLTVETERLGLCVSGELTPGAHSLHLACDGGDVYALPDSVLVFDDPVIAAVAPEAPRPGDTILVTLEGVPDNVLAAVSSPMCGFEDGPGAALTPAPAQLGPAGLSCDLPSDLGAGTTVTVRVSLDGQQFGAQSIDFVIGSSTRTGLGENLIIIIAAVATAVVVTLVMAIVWYRKLANKRVAVGPAPWEIQFDAIQLFDEIGAGAFGSVHRGMFRGGEVAVKVTKGGQVTKESIEAFRRESALMAELRHPNIVLFMGACTEPPNIAIVLEFLPNGSLYDLLHDDRIVLRTGERLSFAIDIVKGMGYLHAADPPIVHRDLKSLNVLVDKNWTLKVSDFGLTEIFSQPKDGKIQQTLMDHPSMVSFSSSFVLEAENQLGSVHWTAPEVLDGQPADLLSDVYSFGVTLWEIWTREIPYTGIPTTAIAVQVAIDPLFRPRSEATIPELYDEIIEKCWSAERSRRPTFAELLEQLTVQVGDSAEHSSVVEFSAGEACVVALRVEGSGELWDKDPALMRDRLNVMRDMADALAHVHHGRVASSEDSDTVVVFSSVSNGVAFATGLQSALQFANWPGVEASAADSDSLFRGLLVAMGVDQGPVDSVGGRRAQPVGPVVDSAARLARRAAGGQILMPVVLGSVSASSRSGFAHFDVEGGNVAAYPEDLKGRHAELQERKILGGLTGAADAAPPWIIAAEDLEIGELIGAGTFGTAHKGTWQGALVMCKQLHRKRLQVGEALDLRMEGGVASKLRHPNVCQFLGVCQDIGAGKVYVVSEYMSKGSVMDAVVASRRPIAPKIKNNVAHGLALGLRYLHKQNPPIVHRSLTARNVMLNKDWVAKVSDFGLARIKDGAATMTKVGSSAYAAPELMSYGKRYDEKADVYAFAVILWEMAAQQPAWKGSKLRMLSKAVLEGRRPVISDSWRTELGDAYVRVMEECWAADPDERPGMGMVVEKL